MADLTAARVALAKTLSDIAGIRASPIFTAQVNPPAAIVMPQGRQSIRFDALGGSISFLLMVQLLASYAEDSGSQAQLDAWIGTGPNSVRAALLTDPTLGGVVDDANLDSIGNYGLTEWAGQTYLGARCMISVMARTP